MIDQSWNGAILEIINQIWTPKPRLGHFSYYLIPPSKMTPIRRASSSWRSHLPHWDARRRLNISIKRLSGLLLCKAQPVWPETVPKISREAAEAISTDNEDKTHRRSGLAPAHTCIRPQPPAKREEPPSNMSPDANYPQNRLFCQILIWLASCNF